MISAWWLLLIIPVSFMVGYCFCGIVTSNERIERCLYCDHNKNRQEQEKEAK